MKTKPIAIFLIIICTFFLAIGQLFFKQASPDFSFDIIQLITNKFLILAIAMYAICAILAIFALRDGELSVLFPLIPLSFIWVAFLAFFILGEVFTYSKIAGILSILIGAFFVGYGGRLK
jgi:drug/metabolite transporter (DMT)-like permease